MEGGRDLERASSQQNTKLKNHVNERSRSFTGHFLNSVVGCCAQSFLHGRSNSIPDDFIIAALLLKDREW